MTLCRPRVDKGSAILVAGSNLHRDWRYGPVPDITFTSIRHADAQTVEHLIKVNTTSKLSILHSVSHKKGSVSYSECDLNRPQLIKNKRIFISQLTVTLCPETLQDGADVCTELE